MRSLQSSQRRVHLSGSDSSGRVRPSRTDFTLLQHSAQPWDWNRLQLWHPTSYLIYLLQCCSMSHLPLHCYTSSQTHLHTKLWWFMLISAKRLNKKKKSWKEKGEGLQLQWCILKEDLHLGSQCLWPTYMVSALHFAYTTGTTHVHVRFGTCMYDLARAYTICILANYSKRMQAQTEPWLQASFCNAHRQKQSHNWSFQSILGVHRILFTFWAEQRRKSNTINSLGPQLYWLAHENYIIMHQSVHFRCQGNIHSASRDDSY